MAISYHTYWSPTTSLLITKKFLTEKWENKLVSEVGIFAQKGDEIVSQIYVDFLGGLCEQAYCD